MNKTFRLMVPLAAALLALAALFALVDVSAQAAPLQAAQFANPMPGQDAVVDLTYARSDLPGISAQNLSALPPMSESEGGWEPPQCIDDCTTRSSSLTDRNIAVDANGFPHIAYGGEQLYYGRYDGADWVMQVVDEGPGAGSNASLALDAAGYPHISYLDSSSGVQYAYQDDSGWHFEIVDSLGGGVPSLALDGNGHPHIAYGKSGTFYAYKDLAGWHIEMASDRQGWNNSLALDQNGNPHISFIRRGGDTIT